MDSSGSCKGSLQLDINNKICAGYCEVKNTWFYGKEVPITEFSSCRANEPCTYTTTNTITVSQSFAFNAGASLGKRSLDSGEDKEKVEFVKRGDALAGLKAGFNVVSQSWICLSAGNERDKSFLTVTRALPTLTQQTRPQRQVSL